MHDWERKTWPAQRRTIRSRIHSYVSKYPGRSATEIANALKEKPATVSSYLNKMFKQGDIDRQRGCGVTGTAYGYWHGHQLAAFKNRS